MTTEELEKKLKITENTAIHCPTLELAKQVLSIFHKLGLKWCNEKHYIICSTNWDKHEENTLYYPFDGLYSSLKFANLTGYKIISAEKFIALHTEAKEFDLENYIPKGQLEGFPKEIISRMLDCQEEQSNKRDVSVFEKNREATMYNGGFDWNLSKEGHEFWCEVIYNKNFKHFFEKYPKQANQESKTAKYVQVSNNAILSDITSTQSSVEINITEDNSQEFRVEDKVYDILLKEVGVVQDIVHSSSIPYGLSVEFKSGVKSYTINGCYIPEYKNPHLLHYRDDYNYDIIDFNNLPKRQEVNRWRAEKGETYYIISSNFKIEGYSENNFFVNDEDYDLGNYFQTKEEAQKVADKLKEYFKQLIKEEYEYERI